MIFSSPVFLFLFLPLIIIFYFVSPARFRNYILLVASLFFYAWGEGFFVAVMMVSILANYLVGKAIGKHRRNERGKIFLISGIGLNLLLLASYKYANFIVDNFNIGLVWLNMPTITLGQVHLPIGISFFSFQAISYIIDIYRAEAPVQKNLPNVALYIAMFPQLIAGPIVRYHDIAREIVERNVSLEDFSCGVRRFIIGLGKKMLIANPTGLIADQIFAIPGSELSFGVAWLGVFCYALQIYFDFSAYSDMAIGLGRMFGFHFLENFNYPYISSSIQEFWRRWHISLSSWFRDYLYIPLGGSKGTVWRTYFNLTIVFVLCGLWHGASWNFVIWGLIHGLFLVLERLGLTNQLNGLWRPLRHLYVILVVFVGWVFFRAETLGASMSYLSAMFGLNQPESSIYNIMLYINASSLLAISVGVIGAGPLFPEVQRRLEQLRNVLPQKTGFRQSLVEGGTAMVTIFTLGLVFLLSVMQLASGTHNPFIYFRF